MATSKREKYDIAAAARRHFGFENLRPGQKDAVDALLHGHDTLVVQPTGSGKSAVYQIAATLLPDPTLIVSPLIALQKDQMDSINAQSAGRAALLNSTQSATENAETLAAIQAGQIKYLFLAPEQLSKHEVTEQLPSISLFVVDEAHCISEWGHDFRPDYLQLGNVIEKLGRPVVLAMTATAAPEVREDIIDRLRLKQPKLFVRGFDRPNIALRVDHFSSEDEKRAALIHRVSWAEKPGIVYVATRKNAELVTEALTKEQIPALCYHGGLKAKERSAIQDRFMQEDALVIVATNAFGMGVDKPNVRFVYHYDIGDSLDSYYQEIGRSGRDGEPADAILFYRAENIGTQRFLASEAKLDAKTVEEITNVLRDENGPVEPAEISDQIDISKRKLANTLHRLEDVGAVETLATGEVQLAADVDLMESFEAASDEQRKKLEKRRHRLEQMQQYAETTSCRREYLLRYFADDFTGPCGNCDNCTKQFANSQDGEGTRREVA